MRSNTFRRWPVRALCAAAIAAAALGWSADPASAHNSPVGYSPAEGAVVTQQPGVFSVTTNEALLDLDGEGAGNAMLITGPTGAAAPLYYGDGCVTLFGPGIETKAQLGEPGEYTVIWQVVSVDGHPVSGKYTFTWQPAAGQTLAKGSAAAPTCGQAAGATPVATDAAASGDTGAALSDVAWIAAALGAVLLFGGGTLLVVRRRRPPAGPTDPAP
jgi:methionine-rich copper-binding protein CopC